MLKVTSLHRKLLGAGLHHPRGSEHSRTFHYLRRGFNTLLFLTSTAVTFNLVRYGNIWGVLEGDEWEPYRMSHEFISGLPIVEKESDVNVDGFVADAPKPLSMMWRREEEKKK